MKRTWAVIKLLFAASLSVALGDATCVVAQLTVVSCAFVMLSEVYQLVSDESAPRVKAGNVMALSVLSCFLQSLHHSACPTTFV